jgi:hypothetical protein
MATLCALAALNALLSAERKRSEAEPKQRRQRLPSLAEIAMERRRRTYNHPVNSNLGLANIPISRPVRLHGQCCPSQLNQSWQSG